jgi:hypothetical protein
MASLYTFGLFFSSFLLFVVEPMFGKMILPIFGGSSSVWLTALVFFQLMLLAGYFYVHATTAWLGLRKQAALHMVVLALPFAVLPVRVLTNGVGVVPEYPLASVTWTLLLSIGLPFFALAASAPLLQRWFAASGPVERDPYFLYAASNLGSLGGLLLYPIVIEPLAGLHLQSRLWAISYGGLVLLVLACASMLWRSGRAPAESAATHQETPVNAGTVSEASPTWKGAVALACTRRPSIQPARERDVYHHNRFPFSAVLGSAACNLSDEFRAGVRAPADAAASHHVGVASPSR